MKEDKEIEQRKKQIKDLSSFLMKITQQLSENIDSFVKNYKQFGKTFVYDQMVSESCVIAVGLCEGDQQGEVRNV